MKHGQGKYKSPDSIFWEGTWKEGKRDGLGKLSVDNKKYVGKWLDDVVLKHTGSQMVMPSEVSFN